MTIEEKAKRYDEAFEVAKTLYCADDVNCMDLETIFPELCESEDERIRNEIMDFIDTKTIDSDKRRNKWIAWLEKQGEQKSVDKVEPFDKYEGLTDFEGTLADICIGWIGEEPGWKQYIKDNADVLLKIAIEKFNSVQDTLFEQKPAWSEEDEKMLNGIIDEIGANRSNAPSYDIPVYEGFLNWLKSLKYRYTWKPSKEQMNALQYVYRNLNPPLSDKLGWNSLKTLY